jgi:hypothetical protein
MTEPERYSNPWSCYEMVIDRNCRSCDVCVGYGLIEDIQSILLFQRRVSTQTFEKDKVNKEEMNID